MIYGEREGIKVDDSILVNYNIAFEIYNYMNEKEQPKKEAALKVARTNYETAQKRSILVHETNNLNLSIATNCYEVRKILQSQTPELERAKTVIEKTTELLKQKEVYQQLRNEFMSIRREYIQKAKGAK